MSAATVDKAEAADDRSSGSRAFSAFERMVAWRYLRSRRKEAFISVIAGFSFIGIMLGVATLIIVMAVMNGFRTELISRILGINGHMIVQPIDGPLDNYADLATRFAGVKGVTMAIPMIEGQTLASGPGGAGTGALVRGVRADDFAKMKAVSDHIQSGDLVGFAAGTGVAIGSRMAQQLGITAGGTITLVAPEGDVTPMGVNPRVKSYTVSAIFEIGMSEYDATIIFMPLEEAQLYFNAEGIAQSVELFVENPDMVDDLRQPIEDAAGRQVLITDWRDRNKTFFSALQVERNVMFMILTLIVLVAALNIVSGPHHAGQGQGQRHRHPAHHGCVFRIDHANLLHDGCCHRHRRNLCRCGTRRRRLPEHRIDPRLLLLDIRHDDLQSRALFPQPVAG